jgi:tetratricopeptide (TPR) repeat protein
MLTFTEMATARRASAIAATVPQEEFDGLTRAWNEYESIVGHSVLGFGVRGLERQLHRQSQVLADRVIANYRSPSPTVREAQWRAAAAAMRRALTIEPGDDRMRAALRYAEGHLHRIDGDAQKSRGQLDRSRREFAEAITAFREAAALRSDWPDPFLGLARTFIYGMEDIDRGADAIKEAERLGFQVGPRETAQLGDGYRTRGEALQRTAATLDELPQERESLTRAADAYRKALELYSSVADYADVAGRIRTTQARLAAVERELERTSDAKSAIDRLIGALSGAF